MLKCLNAPSSVNKSHLKGLQCLHLALCLVPHSLSSTQFCQPCSEALFFGVEPSAYGVLMTTHCTIRKHETVCMKGLLRTVQRHRKVLESWRDLLDTCRQPYARSAGTLQ